MKNEQVELNRFYSEGKIADWKKLLGEDLYYSFGDFSKTNDPQEAFRNNTRNFYAHIPEGAKLLDLGCGWGGPARLLIDEKKVEYTGVTIAQGQYDYCKNHLGLNVLQANMETMHFDTPVDVVFMMESLEHIHDISTLFAKLRPIAKKLIIQTNALHEKANAPKLTFGDSMTTYKQSQIENALQTTGWHAIHAENKRFDSIPTFAFWGNGLNKLKQQNVAISGQFDALERHVKAFQQAPAAWCQTFPLLNLVAS